MRSWSQEVKGHLHKIKSMSALVSDLDKCMATLQLLNDSPRRARWPAAASGRELHDVKLTSVVLMRTPARGH